MNYLEEDYFREVPQSYSLDKKKNQKDLIKSPKYEKTTNF